MDLLDSTLIAVWFVHFFQSRHKHLGVVHDNALCTCSFNFFSLVPINVLNPKVSLLKNLMADAFFLLHCQAVSMQMDELYCHCHICSSTPIGLIQLPPRRSFFCQKNHDMSAYTES